MANARQFMAARTAAWAKSGGGMPTARDYVQDGLVYQLDGLENIGFGKRSVSTRTWKNLCNNGNDAILNGSAKWTNNGIDINPIAYTSSTYVEINSGIAFRNMTLELVCATFDRTTSGRFLGSGEGSTSGGSSSNKIMMYCSDGAGQDNELFGIQYGGGGSSYVVTGASFRKSVPHRFLLSPNDDTRNLMYAVDELIGNWTYDVAPTGYNPMYLGGWNPARLCHVEVFSLRSYDRILTAAEIAANYAIDKARFNLT